MKTRILHTRFWQDSFVCNLSKVEKLAFLYFLTNDRVGLTGVYELPDKYIKIDLDINEEELKNIKKTLKEKIIFNNGWIVIKNAAKFNNYTSNDKLKIAFDREIQQVPKELLRIIKDTSIILVRYTSDTIINQKPKIINDKSEIKNQKSGDGVFFNDWIKEMHAKQ